MHSKSLCEFSHKFPNKVSELLEVGGSFRRNVREETITDLLMVELKLYERFGIRVDFPADESKTGQDMDWEFVAPYALDGRKYLRLHIQAKRAKLNPIAKPYWWYPEIDHATPKGANHGTQHKILIEEAKRHPACTPLYMFYHPKSALDFCSGSRPSILGVNVMPATQIPVNTSKGCWPRNDKKLETWRSHFLPLSDLLCGLTGRPFTKLQPPQGLGDPAVLNRFVPMPGEIVDTLNNRYQQDGAVESFWAEASAEIPASTRRALTLGIVEHLERPRVIFHSRVKSLREDETG